VTTVSPSNVRSRAGVRSVACHGVRFNVVPGANGVFWDVVESGRWEGTTFDVLNRHLGPDVTLIDIGSWIGPISLYVAAKGARVIAVEGDPLALADLRANIAANPELVGRISVVAKAIHPSGKPISFGSRGTGNDSTSSFVHRNMATTWTVETVTPAELAAMVPPPGRLFVKMDIEGGEYTVVPAAGALWSRPNTAALISLHPKFIQPNRLRRALTAIRATGPVFSALAGYTITKVAKRAIVQRPDASVLGPLGLLGLQHNSSWLFTR
jgi:FkbM family methyltransferase